VAGGVPADVREARVSATVAVRLPNWLGDTVMAVPALAALRRALGDRRLVLAGPWVSVLEGQGLADVLVVYPRAWSGRVRSADVVRRFAPETAILMPSSLESALAAWYWGARRRVGFTRPARDLFLTDGVAVPDPRLHQIDEYLLLVEALGVTAASRESSLSPPAPDSEARCETRRLLREAGVPASTSGLRIGVHLGAEYGSSKRWPLERVTDLTRLAARAGDHVVLLGAPADAEAAARVIAAVPAASLVGRDRPALVPAVLAELDVLVSGDTGVAHLAAALGTPVVTLFGPTDPRLTAPRGAVVTLTHAVPCAPCFYRECPIEHPFLAGVPASAVLDAARSLAGARA
jgi:lipopolysaccharide heptosyltransferase II